MIHFLRITPRTYLYFGEEDEMDPKGSPLEPCWFLEDVPPFRRGHSWRFRETPTTGFHVGWARSHPSRSSLESVGGRVLEDVTTEDLRSYGAPELSDLMEELHRGIQEDWDPERIQAIADRGQEIIRESQEA